MRLGSTNINSLRSFLELFPTFFSDFEEFTKDITLYEDLIFPDQNSNYSWCHLYELPIKEHILELNKNSLIGKDLAFTQDTLRQSEDQIGAIPKIVDEIDAPFLKKKITTRQAAIDSMTQIGEIFALSMSLTLSLKSVLYFGLFINDLIAKSKQGDDKSLLNAIKIDPTVVACPTASKRLSKAYMLDDQDFLKAFKRAMFGKFEKREQYNFQMMRLVLEILHEVGAKNLNNGELYELFVQSLNLYSWSEKEGGNEKALRKFVDTYMKKSATT